MKTTPLSRLTQKRAFVFLTGALLLTACGPQPHEPNNFRAASNSPYQKEWGYEQDRTDNRSVRDGIRTYDLVSADDYTVGRAKIYADGSGKLYDTEGRIIGRITPPDATTGHPRRWHKQ